jgi:hypothetical protein
MNQPDWVPGRNCRAAPTKGGGGISDRFDRAERAERAPGWHIIAGGSSKEHAVCSPAMQRSPRSVTECISQAAERRWDRTEERILVPTKGSAGLL